MRFLAHKKKDKIMKNFEGFGLSPALVKSLASMKYTEPTPIQEKAIPLALAGKDVLGSAQTGTGKTAAFSIPLVEALLRSPKGSALVLTPTRELAKQVLDVIHQLLGRDSAIKTAFIIGGEPMGKQLSQLRARPRIIVGTPGRINDHLERGSLTLADAGFLVLDETDRMLDMGFGVQLDRIFKYLPRERQTLMFSATLPQEIIQISEKYLKNPERVSMGATNVVAINIKQDIIRIDQSKKYAELIVQLHERTGSVIIFAKTKYGADRMATNLRRDGFTSDALHGDLRQNKRDQVMRNFRQKNFRILVATDIAARGLDVPHIEHVINYDLPQVAEDYIHRMGRTARAGAGGSALCFISPEDGRKWRAIEQLLNPGAKSSFGNERGGNERSGGDRKFGGEKKFGGPKKFGEKKFGAKRFDDRKFDDRKPASWKSSEPRAAEPRADDRKPEGRKTEERRFETRKPDDRKPTERKWTGKDGKPGGTKGGKAPQPGRTSAPQGKSGSPDAKNRRPEKRQFKGKPTHKMAA
jgi:superfamily II DNA/RNA helicase